MKIIFLEIDYVLNTFGDNLVTINSHVGLTVEIVNIVIERMNKKVLVK